MPVSSARRPFREKWQSYGTALKPKLAQLPSYYFRRQCYSAIMQDDVGPKLARDYDLADNVLWSCDYPHGESAFGESRNEIQKNIRGAGDGGCNLGCGGTAARMWKL
jgi:hypothetical protein